MQTGCNKAGGFIVESRGKNKPWKVVRPKPCCYVPVFAWLVEAKADNRGLLHHSKGFGKQSTPGSCYNHFYLFRRAKARNQQVQMDYFVTLIWRLFWMFKWEVLWWGQSEHEGHCRCLQSWHTHNPCTSEAAGSYCGSLGKKTQTCTLKRLARVGRGIEASPLLLCRKMLGLPAAQCVWEPLRGRYAQAGSLPGLPLLTIMFSGASARSMKRLLPLLPATWSGLWEAVGGKECPSVCPSCP